MSRNNIIVSIFIVICIVGISYKFSSFTELLDKNLLDLQFEYLRNNHPVTVSNDVVIVGIDEQSFREFREPLALWHPHLSVFFNAMAVAKPAILGADLILPDRSYDFIVGGYDKILLSGLLKLKTVTKIVIGQTIDEKKQIRSIFAPLISIIGRDALGLVLVKNDSDEKVRNYEKYIEFGKTRVKTFAPLIAEKLGYEAKGEWINYTLGGSFSYIPLQDVNTWYENGDVQQLENSFNGKIVLLGSVLPFTDRHKLPVKLYADEPGTFQPPGILIHAQILRTILNQGDLRYESKYITFLILIISLLFYFVGQRIKLGMVLLGVFILTLLLSSTFLLSHGYVMPVATYIAITSIALFARILVEGTFSYFDKNRLKYSFGKYVSPNVMEQILAGSIAPDMEGRRVKVCVLFSDIRNFTTRSESQSPEHIISLLNKYFNQMTEAVHQQGGTVDKFIGDGLMVFFGAPNLLENPAKSAFVTAKNMLMRLNALNKQLEQEGIEVIKIGIGLHLGEAVVGHVGSDSRHEYTIIGDTVNLASRLEGRTKELGYPIICSEAVFEALESPDELMEIGYTSIKGRSDAKVFGWKP